MKIFHFSDTHLWLWIENTKREEDFYENYHRIFEEIKHHQPDIIIHTGDLFHTSKPSNKAISVVIDHFIDLQASGIPFIILAGNHDTPRLATTTHPFEIFESFENVESFYLPKIQTLEIKWVHFIILPHIHDENIFKEELQKTSSLLNLNKKNIFLSHFWLSWKEYEEYTDEISGINITIEDIKNLKKCDYVWLWHYHKNFCIGNICYSGSIEHTSFNQKNYKNGYNIIDISWEKAQITPHFLPTRPMVDLWEISVDGISSTQELIDFLEKKIDTNSLKNALVKIILIDVSHLLLLDFDEKKFLKIFEESFYFEYKKFRKWNAQEIFQSIQHSSNIIVDNFPQFYENIESSIPKEYTEKIFSEIKNDLKHI